MAAVVMTGGTSGFGLPTAEHLRDAGWRVLLGSRGPSAGVDAEVLGLDLTSLDAVRSFAGQVRDRLGEQLIDALVLNAGIVRPDATARSADGHELTFAVNHLAHYLLLRLLLDRMAQGGVVVLTTSGTHDPTINGGLAPPRHADARLLADPTRDPGAQPKSARGGQEAYTASKLCSVMTVRALADHPDVARRRLRVLAYCPGQVFGTGLAADLSLARRTAWRVMGTPVSAPLRRFVPTLNTRRVAGVTLGRLALGEVVPPEGRAYAALRRGQLTWPDASELARDDRAVTTLWQDSAALVGLGP
ncbi:SDR family NAD(P)-dependent oxidoreductase [Ornithinimicrobium faecis]|uniref:SDR family NAD(P)-dependent oxidoreductase n=1 Tax=Ornithinimicrobium faecis TaxID=2934158 RepID=UPI0021198200|nr:SDR family NAD(P)-dependent oxidoreductase [Ornithinimicrobium sp. HY1745]